MSIHALVNLLSWNLAFWSALVLYSLACVGAGLLMLRVIAGPRAAEEHASTLTLVGLAAALGLGLLGQLWTLLALAGFFRKPVTYSIIVLLVVALAIYGWPLRRKLIKDVREIRAALQLERLGIRAADRCRRLGRVHVCGAWTAAFGDSLNLHMLVAKTASASGMLVRHFFLSTNEYFGIVGEMTYAALMQIGNPDAAQMSTWAIVPVFMALLAGICGKAGIGLRGKVIALTGFASTTAVLIWIGEGKIDLIASVLGLAALYLLVPRADLAPLPRHVLMLAGLTAGLAITAKLMLGFCLAIASAILLFWTFAPAPLRTRRPWEGLTVRSFVPLLSAELIFGAFTLIGVAPQFIKNWVLLDAPFAPLGTANTNWLVRELWYDAETVTHIRRLYPFVLTFGEYFAQYGQISVLVLAFLPLALFMPRPQSFWHSPLTAITLAAVAAIIGWSAFQGDKVVTRYILPALLLCIPIAAAAAEYVTSPSFRPRMIGTAVIGACFATLYITAYFSYGYYYFPAQAVRTTLGLSQPCDRGLQWCPPMEAVNRTAPPGARVLSVSLFSYYLRPDLLQCLFDNRTNPFPGDSKEDRWRWLYEQGFSFVLPDLSGNPPHLASDLNDPPAWAKVTRHQPENPLGPIQISYDLSKGGPTVPPKFSCRETRRNIWKIVQTGS